MTWTALTVPLTGDRAGGSMPVPSTIPNGEYTDSEIIGYKYVTWKSWKNSYISLKLIQLMIRPEA